MGAAERIGAVRRFNRFYTQRIGVLGEGLLESPFSLAEARVLYELGQAPERPASALAKELGLDPGYLSRILKGFAAQGVVAREPSAADRRQRTIALTPRGRAALAPLEAQSDAAMGRLLEPLGPAGEERLVAAMGTIERLLAGEAAARAPYLLRPHRPGDIGWVVERHAAYYVAGLGWDASFEALVAEIGANFLRRYDPARERCWIAERDGRNLGSVALVKHRERTAKLRLLLVEPEAQGLGIGRRLVEECIRFAAAARYRKITLWTVSELTAARAIYRRAGFRLVRAVPGHSFGGDRVDETWELALA